jgi:hypothetical protein
LLNAEFPNPFNPEYRHTPNTPFGLQASKLSSDLSLYVPNIQNLSLHVTKDITPPLQARNCKFSEKHAHLVSKRKLDSVKAGGVYIHHYTLEGLKQDYCTYFKQWPTSMNIQKEEVYI